MKAPGNYCLLGSFLVATLGVVASHGQDSSFSPPAGGWDYLYGGDQLIIGAADSGFTSLDGTWSHDNGSDAWDGSEIGGTFGPENGPGGVSLLGDAEIQFIRIQDPGDPRDYDFPDPSNRKVYFGHDMSMNGASETVLDDGVTLTFKARIPTPGTGVLDPLHPDGQQANGTLAYPDEGDGYVTSDGGKGNFVIKQAAGGAIAFSLTQLSDTNGGNPNGNKANFAGLTMNEFNGNQISGNVNFGDGSATNLVEFDPTEWHELWIVLRKDESEIGTHQGFIYRDGSTNPEVFRITAGSGSDYSGISYLAIGATATPQNAALDIDFVGYKIGAHFPEGAGLPPDIRNLSPDVGKIQHEASLGLSFTAIAEVPGQTVPTDTIKLVLNGEDVSADLTFGGDATARTVMYSGLSPNRFYSGEISIADQDGNTVDNPIFFDTFAPDNFVWEAEDFNFDGGQFIDNPVVSFTDANSYVDKGNVSGMQDVDFNELAPADGEHIWRIPSGADLPQTSPTADFLRQKYIDAGVDPISGTPDVPDYNVGWTVEGEWLNYTRTFPSGSWGIVGRFSNGNSGGTAILSRVTNPTSASQTTTDLGVFNVPSTGSYDRYVWVPLTDSEGKQIAIDLDGLDTLRVTTGPGGYDTNFYMLIPASDIVVISDPDPAMLTVSVVNGMVTVDWDQDGVLEYTTDIGSGNWTAVENAGKPHTETADGVKFFRVRGGN